MRPILWVGLRRMHKVLEGKKKKRQEKRRAICSLIVNEHKVMK